MNVLWNGEFILANDWDLKCMYKVELLILEDFLYVNVTNCVWISDDVMVWYVFIIHFIIQRSPNYQS